MCEIRNIDKIEYLGAGTYEKYFSSRCTYRICWLKNSEFIDVFTGSSYGHMASFLVDSGEPVVYRYEFLPFITEKVSESELIDYYKEIVKKLNKNEKNAVKDKNSNDNAENLNSSNDNTSEIESNPNGENGESYAEEIEK